MSPPLAGKPPYATDEPDSFYETSGKQVAPTRRPAPTKEDPNKRTSAYDVYDSYLAPGNTAGNNPRPNSTVSTASRNSGIGGIGMGLLNMDDDSDDDSDDEAFERKRREERTAKENNGTSRKASPPVNPFESQAEKASTNPFETRSPPPIAAPRPGYAAPIAALNKSITSSPSPTFPQAEPAMAMPQPQPTNPFEPITAPNANGNVKMRAPPPLSPIAIPPSGTVPPALSPTPLQPPITPIMPVFAVPKKETNIQFDDLPAPTPRKPIMRGNGEETLLPRRGEKGDDFWRRFSMIAKTENGKKESSWLQKTRSQSNSLSRWVWVIGIILLIIIGAAIGLGVYLSKDKPDHQAPATLGGTGEKAAATFPTSTLATATATSSSIRHVSPTHTIARRAHHHHLARAYATNTDTLAAAVAPSPCPDSGLHARDPGAPAPAPVPPSSRFWRA